MRKYLAVAVVSGFISIFLYAHAAPQKNHPGAELFTPTRIDWLTTSLQASLREEITQDRAYSIDITSPDSETILIYVRYIPNMSGNDRTIMNMDIETARTVINTMAKSYGWQDWLRIKEDVKAGTANAQR